MNLNDKFSNNSTVYENPLHSSNTALTSLSSFINNNEDTMHNLIFNDHLNDDQIKKLFFIDLNHIFYTLLILKIKIY